MLDKYKQQRKDLDKIVPNQMLGLFHVKLQWLKNVVKPTCEDLLRLVELTMVKYVFINQTANTNCFIINPLTVWGN